MLEEVAQSSKDAAAARSRSRGEFHENFTPASRGGGDGSDIGAVEVDALQAGPTFVVTNTDEHSAADEGCTADDCTFAEAIAAANANADPNTITFANGVGGTITNGLLAGGFGISQPVNIVGPGARQLAINGRNTFRLFNIASQNVAISGLTFTFGRSFGSDGGQSTTAAV